MCSPDPAFSMERTERNGIHTWEEQSGNLLKAIVPAHLCRPSPPRILTEVFVPCTLFCTRREISQISRDLYSIIYIHYRVEITLTDKTRGKKSLRSQQIKYSAVPDFFPKYGLHICPIGCVFSRQSKKRCIRIGLFQNLRKSLRGRLEGTSG